MNSFSIFVMISAKSLCYKAILNYVCFNIFETKPQNGIPLRKGKCIKTHCLRVVVRVWDYNNFGLPENNKGLCIDEK